MSVGKYQALKYPFKALCLLYYMNYRRAESDAVIYRPFRARKNQVCSLGKRDS